MPKVVDGIYRIYPWQRMPCHFLKRPLYSHHFQASLVAVANCDSKIEKVDTVHEKKLIKNII